MYNACDALRRNKHDAIAKGFTNLIFCYERRTLEYLIFLIVVPMWEERKLYLKTVHEHITCSLQNKILFDPIKLGSLFGKFPYYSIQTKKIILSTKTISNVTIHHQQEEFKVVLDVDI